MAFDALRPHNRENQLPIPLKYLFSFGLKMPLSFSPFFFPAQV